MLGLITQFCFGYGIVFKDEKKLTGGGIMLIQFWFFGIGLRLLSLQVM